MDVNYFNSSDRFKGYIEAPKDIKELLTDDMFLISGDFYGIQKFIFEGLSTKNASKVLRAKSAFIQIFTEYLAKFICHKLNIDEQSILTVNAGKFEILSSKDLDIDKLQKTLDEYFIKNFFGLSGIMLTSVRCKQDDFKSGEKYKSFRKKVIDSIEEKKFKKFKLHNYSHAVLEYDTDIDNQTLCPICNIRKKQENKEQCKICQNFINLGRKLSSEHTDEIINSKELGLFIDDFSTNIKLTKKIKSYTLFEENSPADFKTLADNSCKDLVTGVKTLAVLKADVDNMGKFLQNSDVTNSFEKFDSFSTSIDNFFSLYIPKLMKKKYPDTYTVFAGGDDLFLLGAWDEILKLAREIEKEFKEFIKSDDLSISFGIALAKPSTPISYLANHTEELLEEAKDIDENKDAISLFGETLKWNSYKKTFEVLQKLFENFNDPNTATLYRLLDFCKMSKDIDKDLKNSMWKSKLNYLFKRNVDKKYHHILGDLSSSIEKNPKETKMFLSEFIYKRRES